MKKWMTFLCILLLCSSQTLLSVSAAPAKSVSSTPRQTQDYCSQPQISRLNQMLKNSFSWLLNIKYLSST